MRTTKTLGASAILSLGLSFVAFVQPASAEEQDEHFYFPFHSGYQVYSGTRTNKVRGHNFYLQHDNWTVPGGIKSKWVKCGYTATQDGASRVGGAARIASYMASGTIVGTNFKKGSCVRVWSRPLTSAGWGGDFGYWAFFGTAFHP